MGRFVQWHLALLLAIMIVLPTNKVFLDGKLFMVATIVIWLKAKDGAKLDSGGLDAGTCVGKNELQLSQILLIVICVAGLVMPLKQDSL
jgi:hypothetical protein